MAGKGPPPKDNAAKGRRHQAEEVDLPASGRSGRTPALGSSYRVREWHPDKHRHVERTVRFLAETRAWWEVWAKSPQATRFSATAWERLRMLARLVDRFHRGEVELMAEIRLNEAKLGGTPEDLQRLRWRVIDAPRGAQPAPAETEEPARPSRSSEDPRLRLVE